jgi:uncharacterized protein
MGLQEEIKKRMFAAMKAQKIVEKEILRVATGEITMAIARAEVDSLTDEQIHGILKKLLKSNQEAMAAGPDEERRAILEEEVTILEGLLPKKLSAQEIASLLADVAEPIRAAAGAGPAMGLAMKTLKQKGAEVDAKDVTQAVALIRG